MSIEEIRRMFKAAMGDPKLMPEFRVRLLPDGGIEFESKFYHHEVHPKTENTCRVMAWFKKDGQRAAEPSVDREISYKTGLSPDAPQWALPYNYGSNNR